MLQRCSRFAGSKQFLSRAHRIDHAEVSGPLSFAATAPVVYTCNSFFHNQHVVHDVLWPLSLPLVVDGWD
jgi:hypothetical protein